MVTSVRDERESCCICLFVILLFLLEHVFFSSKCKLFHRDTPMVIHLYILNEQNSQYLKRKKRICRRTKSTGRKQNNFIILLFKNYQYRIQTQIKLELSITDSPSLHTVYRLYSILWGRPVGSNVFHKTITCTYLCLELQGFLCKCPYTYINKIAWQFYLSPY